MHSHAWGKAPVHAPPSFLVSQVSIPRFSLLLSLWEVWIDGFRFDGLRKE